MVSLLQGLRSLARYDVVHLDIKPNNIMLSPELLIKLLDFGESYHPDIKGKPGNTEPYSCP
jgi:serine/threonine protein kinase